MEFTVKPIGVIHTPFIDKKQTPIQPTRSQELGQVEVYPE
jgi:tRNA (Thr-GGU) A37 N-methylase